MFIKAAKPIRLGHLNDNIQLCVTILRKRDYNNVVNTIIDLNVNKKSHIALNSPRNK